MPEVPDQQVAPGDPEEESGTSTGVSAEQAELLASRFQAVWETDPANIAAGAREAAVVPIVPVVPVVPVHDEVPAADAPPTPELSAAGLAENSGSANVELSGSVAARPEGEPLLSQPRRLSHQTMIGLAPVSASPEPHVPPATAPPQAAPPPAVLGSETSPQPLSDPAAIAAQPAPRPLSDPPAALAAEPPPRPLSALPEPELSGQMQELAMPPARVVASFDDGPDVDFRPRSRGQKWVAFSLIGAICLLLAAATKLLTAGGTDAETPARSEEVRPPRQTAEPTTVPTQTAPDTNRAPGGEVGSSSPTAGPESRTRPQANRRGRARTDTTVSSAPPAARGRRSRPAKTGPGRAAALARPAARESEPATLPAPKHAAGSIVRETPF